MSSHTSAAAVEIRAATPADVPAVTAIYAHAVNTGCASFELAPPDESEMAARLVHITEAGFPWLVAEADGRILGYAYCGTYRTRPAYRFTVENAIYVAPDAHRRGIGRLLIAAVIEKATALGHRQMIAVIGDSANAASIALHTAAGFTPAGVLRAVGWKHGRWLDSVLMQRPLGRADTSAPADGR